MVLSGSEINAHIIYLNDDSVILSKNKYADWQEIQNEYYEKFITSLGPMTYEEIICFFTNDFGSESSWPFHKDKIKAFFNGDTITISTTDCTK